MSVNEQNWFILRPRDSSLCFMIWARLNYLIRLDKTVCLCVNQGGTNRNRYMWRIIIFLAQT